MSDESEESTEHIDRSDVASLMKNGPETETTAVPVIDSMSLTSPTDPGEPNTTIEPPEPSKNAPEVCMQKILAKDQIHESIDSIKSPIASAIDCNHATDNTLNLDKIVPSRADDDVDKTADNTQNASVSSEKCNQDSYPSTNGSSDIDISSTVTDSSASMLVLEKENAKPSFRDGNIKIPLGTSTTSLNEQCLDTKISLIKSPQSKSAENITTSLSSEQENPVLTSSTKELNTDKILSEFSSQKQRATATQKLTPDLPQKDFSSTTETSNPDLRYARLPKEILSQDIGSIVKNVHGIFSSVSGSLKNAYNHSQRASTPKPVLKTIKPISNGNVMDDIFEDEKSLQSNVAQKSETENTPSITNINSLKDTEQVSMEIQTSSDAKKEVLKLQIESLERVLAEQRHENASLRDRVKQQFEELEQKDQTFKELEGKLDAMTKRVETAERDKDAAVMRYASVECAAIEARKAAERSAAAERAALAEAELMSGKLKSAHAEKHRICQLYDDKCHELSNSERELSKVREDIKELEGRLKWTQSKLRMEMDAYKESSERAERLSTRVAELEAAKEASAANAADCARAKQLESELAGAQAALILCRHERDALERRSSLAERQLKDAEATRDANAQRAESACAEVEVLRAANMRLEQEAAELAALRAQASLADTLSAQLQRELERATQAEEAASRERARADTCARREASALEHGARLTAQHVAAAAAAETAGAKAQALEVDNAALRERAASLESEREVLAASLKDETERRAKECRVLARKVAELTEEVNEANKKLEWEKGENDVLRKKHASAVKELNRELHRALKRCEQLEAKLTPPDAASTRTESVSSLSSGEGAHEDSRPQVTQNGHSDGLPDIQVREPDRQSLIERIVSLQRAAARRAERCEFLEEHSRQLTTELRAKSRLLRNLLCTLPAGAVASHDSDTHKKEIARLGGGAMAALWGGDPAGMTLELSLEMNKRLQAVLEDALLKNITLKENMDTLGEEIARLKRPQSTTETKQN